jgi:hypothetical protein
MSQPSLGLSVGLLLGAELILGLRLAWSWKTAPAIAGEGQTAQYGPPLTDVGSDVLAQADPKKVYLNSAVIGNLVRQSQRSWLNKDAS